MKEKFVLTLDSSQLESFSMCPTLWRYAYKLRLGLISGKRKPYMDMGTYGHKILEILYKERAKGNSSGALDVALNYDIDKMTCRCSHGAEHHEYSNGEMLDITQPNPCQSAGCHCEMFSGVEFPLTKEERETVKNRCIDYYTFEGSAFPELIPTSPEHVEVGFSYNLFEDDERLYILEGRIDLLGQIANNVPDGWADHKFQTREYDLYLKSIQFRNYSLVAQRTLGVVNYIRFAKKIEKDKTFKRAIISFSRIEMSAWKENVIKIFHQVENAIKGPLGNQSEEHWYNVNDLMRRRSACSNKYGFCQYTDLCDDFYNPEMIKWNEKQLYQILPEWRPW